MIPIAVFGKYGVKVNSPAYRLAHDIGFALAGAGFAVVSGGYAGTMAAVSQGAQDAGGHTIGVTCSSVLEKRSSRKPNPFLNVIFDAPSMIARLEKLMRMSGGYVALPGGTGTLAELALVLEFVNKGFIAPRPIALVGEHWKPVMDVVEPSKTGGLPFVHRVQTAAEVAEVMQAHAIDPAA